MKEFSIEDKIIAYFDGRLSDNESAELLHRVSVSPEIREAFQEHEMLREISFRAARNVSVPTHLEDAVFSNLAALQQAERQAAPLAFWTARRIYTGVGAAILLLLAGALGGVELATTGTGFVPSSATTATHAIASTASRGSVTSEGSVVSGSNSNGVNNERPNIVSSNQFAHNSNTSVEHTNAIAVVTEGDNARSVSIDGQPERDIAMIPPPRTTEVQAIRLPEASGLPLNSLRDLTPTDATPEFEIGLETATQFSIPSAQLSWAPFQDFRFHAGYNLDDNNAVGVRVRSGSFEHLEAVASAGDFSTELNASLRPARMMSGEAYYEHREPIANGHAWLVAGIGGGFYTDGSLFSADFGVKIPVADHLLAGFSVALSRLHQNGTTSDFLNGQSGPVIYTGDQVRNSINGRLEYGLSYQF